MKFKIGDIVVLAYLDRVNDQDRYYLEGAHDSQTSVAVGAIREGKPYEVEDVLPNYGGSGIGGITLKNSNNHYWHDENAFRKVIIADQETLNKIDDLINSITLT